MKVKIGVSRIMLVLVLLLGDNLWAQPGEEYHNDVWKLINNDFYGDFHPYKDAVCYIFNRNRVGGADQVGTGVLLNNTTMDGTPYVLTSAHILIEENENFPTIQELNNRLRHFTFNFDYEREEGDNSLNPITRDTDLDFVGARIVSFYSSNLPADGNFHLQPIDLVLLELNEWPEADDEYLYLGWTLDYNFTGANNENYVILHHPNGHPKKVSQPINGISANVWNKTEPTGQEHFFAISAGNPYNQNPPNRIPEHTPFTSILNPENPGHDINNTNINNEPQNNGYYSMFEAGRNGIPVGGSSGAPYINRYGRIFAIHRGGIQDNEAEETELYEKYSRGIYLTWDIWTNNRSQHATDPYNKPLSNFLSPGPNPPMSLEAAYPCMLGVNGIPQEDQNRLLTTYEINEDITDAVNGTIAASEEITISANITNARDLHIKSREVTVNQGSEIPPGSNVTITSGGLSGIGCVTGCYSIEDTKGSYTINDGGVYGNYYKDSGEFYGHVVNAETVEITINVYPTRPDFLPIHLEERAVSDEFPKILDLQEGHITKSGEYRLTAVYKNGCDELTVRYQLFIDQTGINQEKSDYFEYANHVLVKSSYLQKKKTLAQSYMVDNGYNPDNSSNLPEDVSFKVLVAEDITYAKAHGFKWSFRGNADYGNNNGFLGIPEFPSFREETLADENSEPNGLIAGNLKMDVYYPESSIDYASQSSLPLIIFAFGGGFIKKEDSELAEKTCKWLANKGYVVAAIDYRIGMNVEDGQLAKRAVIRAWQDMEAAVKYWRLKPDNENFGWKIDTDKIYGLGWSSGGITVLQNIYLTRDLYDLERISSDKFLYATTDQYGYIENDPQPDGSPGPSEAFYTYDLEEYPTIPCFGASPNPCDVDLGTLDFADGRLNKGISFAGALGKPEWMDASDGTKVADIHHKDDHVVPFKEDTPFGYIGTFASIAETFNEKYPLAKVYGGGALKKYADENNIADFSLLELDGKHQAGQRERFLGYHRPQLQFGDKWSKVKENPKLENKIMFYVDAFFARETPTPFKTLKQDNYASKDEAASDNSTVPTNVVETEENKGSNVTMVPNPSSDYVNISLQTKTGGSITFEFFSLDGKLLHTEKRTASEPGIQHFTLYTHFLMDGIYLVRGKGAGISFSKKLAIKKTK